MREEKLIRKKKFASEFEALPCESERGKLLIIDYAYYEHKLVGRELNLPDFFFIGGSYIKPDEKEQLIKLLNAIKLAEKHTYAIRAQKKIDLALLKGVSIFKDLVNELKIVSLNGQAIHCTFNYSSRFLNISRDCILSACIPQKIKFTIKFSIDDSFTAIERNINIYVIKKIPISYVLLGRPQVTYVHSNATINLSYLCLAVAYPQPNDLQCKVEGLPEAWSTYNCSIVRTDLRTRNISIVFFNNADSKTCQIALALTNKSITLTSLLAANKSLNDNVWFNFSSELNKTISNTTLTPYSAYWIDRHFMSAGLYLSSLSNSADFISENGYRHIKQAIYIIGIPTVHGIYEGVIDETALTPMKKSILKLMPRIVLVYLNYLSTLQFPILFFYSLVEGCIGKCVDKKGLDWLNYLITCLLFIVVTELEYGFYNLWALSDKPEFWPGLTDRFNQLFTQVLLAPYIKGLGYLMTISFIQCIKVKSNRKTLEINIPLVSEVNDTECNSDYSFFSAVKNAANTVFSRKVLQLPSLFFRQVTHAFDETRSALPKLCEVEEHAIGAR